MHCFCRQRVSRTLVVQVGGWDTPVIGSAAPLSLRLAASRSQPARLLPPRHELTAVCSRLTADAAALEREADLATTGAVREPAAPSPQAAGTTRSMCDCARH